MRLRRFRLAPLLGSALFAMGTALMSQRITAPYAFDEGSAQQLLLYNFVNPEPVRHDAYVKAAYGKVAAAARGPMTTQAYTWARAYVASPEFRKAYGAMRETNRPENTHQGTIDEEVKAKLAELRREIDTTYQEAVAAGMKAQAEEIRKQFDASMASMEPVIRAEVQEARTRDGADYTTATKAWQEHYPADPLVLVRKHLAEYLSTTADVDFAAKQVQRRNGIGELEWVFVNEAYNQKPWQWKASFDYGASGTAAARAAAAAWLKELGSP